MKKTILTVLVATTLFAFCTTSSKILDVNVPSNKAIIIGKKSHKAFSATFKNTSPIETVEMYTLNSIGLEKWLYSFKAGETKTVSVSGSKSIYIKNLCSRNVVLNTTINGDTSVKAEVIEHR